MPTEDTDYPPMPTRAHRHRSEPEDGAIEARDHRSPLDGALIALNSEIHLLSSRLGTLGERLEPVIDTNASEGLSVAVVSDKAALMPAPLIYQLEQAASAVNDLRGRVDRLIEMIVL